MRDKGFGHHESLQWGWQEPCEPWSSSPGCVTALNSSSWSTEAGCTAADTMRGKAMAGHVCWVSWGKKRRSRRKVGGNKRKEKLYVMLHEKKCTAAPSTEKAKPCPGHPFLSCKGSSGMERLKQGGGKRMLQRAAGPFWAPRRATALL